MKMTRRDFIKSQAIAVATTSAGIAMPVSIANAADKADDGLRSNNLDPNVRHCMASAVGAFMRTFGIDEPMGCYDDLEHAGVFVLWGSNMAEMHPILWSRLADTCQLRHRLRSLSYSFGDGRRPDSADSDVG